MVFQNIYVLKTFKTFKDDFYGETMETVKRLISKGFPWEYGGKILSEVTFEETKRKKRVKDDLKLLFIKETGIYVSLKVVQNVH